MKLQEILDQLAKMSPEDRAALKASLGGGASDWSIVEKSGRIQTSPNHSSTGYQLIRAFASRDAIVKELTRRLKGATVSVDNRTVSSGDRAGDSYSSYSAGGVQLGSKPAHVQEVFAALGLPCPAIPDAKKTDNAAPSKDDLLKALAALG